ncbi:MAG: zf-HC2 domain-containing protein [Gemmatimonadaceae bacterium]|nr:zf-HC2 domain-containing protein [Gemmatimonadaceae bacterium]
MTATPPLTTPIDCETAVRRLWDYIDGALAEHAAVEVATHLAACAKCPPHFAFARSFLLAVGRTATIAPHGAATRERVLRALEAEGFSRAG